MNSAAPWDAWPISEEQRPEGYPIVSGERIVTRVEALSDRFRITVPFASEFTYDYMYRPEIGSVWDANEIYVADFDTIEDHEATQRVVVSKVSVYHALC